MELMGISAAAGGSASGMLCVVVDSVSWPLLCDKVGQCHRHRVCTVGDRGAFIRPVVPASLCPHWWVSSPSCVARPTAHLLTSRSHIRFL